jgi:hypothetical protein
LLTFITQLATTLLCSRSSSNDVVDFVIQFATTLPALVTQLATTFVVIFRRELSILHEYVSHHRGEFTRTVYRGRQKLLSHTGIFDAAWSAVHPKPRFTVVRKIMAMAVREPQCQLAAEYD